jgi:hypothetical protein
VNFIVSLAISPRGETVNEGYRFDATESVIESLVFARRFGHAEFFSFAVVESVCEILNFIHAFNSGEFVSET